MSLQDEIYYKCPSCGRRLASPAATAGKLGSCPQCKGPVMVPVRMDRFAFLCVCGKKLYSKRALTGKPVRCPFCNAAVRIPAPTGAGPQKKLADPTMGSIGDEDLPVAKRIAPRTVEAAHLPSPSPEAPLPPAEAHAPSAHSGIGGVLDQEDDVDLSWEGFDFPDDAEDEKAP